MSSSSKKSTSKAKASKKQALAKQALKKNTKKVHNHKSKNAQLLEVLDQSALVTLQDASNTANPLERQFADLYSNSKRASQVSLNDLTSFMQKI